MKLFHKSKDGGPDSNVTGYWLIEWKPVFSIVLLRFDKGSREAYHNHAFNAVSWVLKGRLREHILVQSGAISSVDICWIPPDILPIYTSRERMHRVYGEADTTWVLSFRGPWKNTWKEYFPKLNKFVTLSDGRKEIKAT